MNQTKKFVIAFSKDTLTFVLVRDGSKPTIYKQTSVSWSKQNIVSMLQTIVQKTGVHSFSLLLMDDIAYTHVLSFDKPKGKNTLRSEIYKLLCEQIPEVFMDSQWDYKILTTKGKNIQVVAFAPVLSFFSDISDALHTVDLIPNSIESEALAKTRNENPFIGTIQKRDIKGNDDDSINIALLPKKVETHAFTEQKDQRVKRKPIVRAGFMYTLILTLLCSFLSLILIQTNRPPKYVVYAPYEKEMQTTESLRTVSQSLQLEQLRVQILNGSGVTGQAKNIESVLLDRGFVKTQIGTGSTDDGALTFRIKESSTSGELTATLQDLFKEISPLTFETLQQDSEYDIIIIIGRLYGK